MLDHFHIAKGAVRVLLRLTSHTTDVCPRLYRVSPTTRIAARLRSHTLLKVLANTRTLQAMRVSSEKVACSGCARYVLYDLLCAKRSHNRIHSFFYHGRAAEVSHLYNVPGPGRLSVISSHPCRNAHRRTWQARTSRPSALDRLAEAVQDDRTFVPRAGT